MLFKPSVVDETDFYAVRRPASYENLEHLAEEEEEEDASIDGASSAPSPSSPLPSSSPTEINSKLAFTTCVLLMCSCMIMITAWYFHLKFHGWSMGKAIFISWLIALGEYCLMIPANRLGRQSGLSTASLRAISEIFILLSFLVFQTVVLKEKLIVNSVVGFAIVLLGVFVVLLGPFTSEVKIGAS